LIEPQYKTLRNWGKKLKSIQKEKVMAIVLPDLPYQKDALVPHISTQTLDFHHGKHHNAYVTNLNKLIEGTDLAGEALEEIIHKTVGVADKVGVFNNAAQVWNHSFYWQSMKPHGGGLPTGEIAKKIDADFGDYDNFIKQLKNAGLTQFGSGWVWLVLKNNTLEIMKTSNADTPIAHGIKPLLTVDVWEHAYYLDYQNGRGNYLDTFMSHLINWDFVNSHLI
jgi:superoxide dismutase, Fe-Mn family